MEIDVTGKLLIVKWNGEISSVHIQYTLIVFYIETCHKTIFLLVYCDMVFTCNYFTNSSNSSKFITVKITLE